MAPPAGPVVRDGTLPATLEQLPALLAALDEAARDAGLADEPHFAVHLAVEEACANVIRHGYRTTAASAAGPLHFRFEIDARRVVVTLVDEAPTFPPDDAPAAVLDGPAEDRAVGGLGWHLIRQTMDEIHHEAVPGGGNRLTLVKRIPAPPAPVTS